MNKAFVVAGLGFGDEGKGSFVERLVRKHAAHTVIRYSGGAQAAHNVVRPGGTHHTFQQFGSGTFEDADTFLSEHVIIHPLRILDEALALQSKGVQAPLQKLAIDSRALVITPYHQSLNQVKERMRDLKGLPRHGSTGLGIGETRAFSLTHPSAAIRACDLSSPHLEDKLRYLAGVLIEQTQQIVGSDIDVAIDESVFNSTLDAYLAAGTLLNIVPDYYFSEKIASAPGNIVFEGAQGILLDEMYGFSPYNTWTDTTIGNAMVMLSQADYPDQDITTIGVLRPYMSRHGAGPLPTEDSRLTPTLQDQHNTSSEWTGPMRYGYLDMVLLRYAVAVGGSFDTLAVTHIDQLPVNDTVSIATSYDYSEGTKEWTLPDVIGGLLYAGDVGDLEAQEAITSKLARCKPNYKSITGGVSSVLRTIEDALGVPISMVSYGPTINDKREIDASKTHSKALAESNQRRG